MAYRPKHKMPPSVRAKQFAPFAALKGFEEALQEKEKICVERKEISEERACEINETLKRICKGDTIRLTYYKNRQYFTDEGIAQKYDLAMKYVEINGCHIPFYDIYEIEKLDT